MAESILTSIATLTLTPANLNRLGLPPGRLELRRAWPYGPGHLGLEYITNHGHIIAGQWFGEAEQLERVADKTADQVSLRASVVIVEVGGTRVLLQGRGADCRLSGLAPLLACPEARLLAHRPERRAVVRLETPTGLRYAKVVLPKRIEPLAAAGRFAHNLTGAAFATPELLEMDSGAGVIIWSALPGASLYDLSSSQRLIPAVRAVGQALNTLHAASPPANISSHNADAEIRVIKNWIERLETFLPELSHLLRLAAAGVFEALAAASSPHVPLHRDFYDKQVLVDVDGRVGLLDFDTLAAGEAALDLANALIHFELRSLQGYCPPEQARAAAAAMMEGYQPNLLLCHRLQSYADATRLRLACVYAFRPAGTALIPALLAQIGRPVIGTMMNGENPSGGLMYYND
jgi:aminoglycoside phosphotransferase